MGSMRDHEYRAAVRRQQLATPQAVPTLPLVSVKDRHARTVILPLDKTCTELLAITRLEAVTLELPIADFRRALGDPRSMTTRERVRDGQGAQQPDRREHRRDDEPALDAAICKKRQPNAGNGRAPRRGC